MSTPNIWQIITNQNKSTNNNWCLYQDLKYNKMHINLNKSHNKIHSNLA
jgi:hypothetical protein